MPQGLDGIELAARRAGKKPKITPMAAENRNATTLICGLKRYGTSDHFGKSDGCKRGQDNADESAERGEHDRLDEELQQHFALERADGQANADLARPLGHRHQHDVHDADAADQQAHRRPRRRAASS